MKNIIKTIFFVLILSASVNSQHISVNSVDGTWDTGKIIPGCGVTFYIRVNNSTAFDISGFTAGFKIYTSGGTFTPPVADTIYPGFTSFFDGFNTINYFSADGSGADTVGFAHGKFFSNGLPAGFNDVVYTITTGGVEPFETLCLDSTFFPPTGTWLWVSNEAGAIVPSWDGPHCFTSEMPPCLPVSVDNWVDTLTFYGCDTLQYHFNAVDDIKCKSSLDTKDPFHEFKLWDGPGMLDPVTGDWFFIAGTDDLNTTQTLNFGVYDIPYCLGNEYTTVINILDSGKPGDLNQSCTVDVGDLVFMVNFMFADGEPPPFLIDADVDGSGTIDIADLVYMVNYMFNDGPPPVDPPPIE